MNKFQPHIIPVYPPSNFLIFEEWFWENWNPMMVNTDRELLPIFPTSFHVNNGYGAKANELQEYCDTLDPDKKYFLICQYDDGCMVDWKGKDVLEFNMSKQNGVMIPLLCQSKPFNFSGSKRWVGNFIGSKTHPIRDCANDLKEKDGYYISFEPHSIEQYCKIIYESIFTLCYRGYGINSFRIAEALQFGSIPVYISTNEDFVIPFGLDFEEFGVLIKGEDVYRTQEILEAIPPEEIIRKQDRIPEIYQEYYTYEGAMKHIIKYLENERKSTTAYNSGE